MQHVRANDDRAYVTSHIMDARPLPQMTEMMDRAVARTDAQTIRALDRFCNESFGAAKCVFGRTPARDLRRKRRG